MNTLLVGYVMFERCTSLVEPRLEGHFTTQSSPQPLYHVYVCHYCGAAVVLLWCCCGAAVLLWCCCAAVVQCCGAAMRVVTVCVVLCDDDIDLFVAVTPRVTTTNTHTQHTVGGGRGCTMC